MPRSTSMAGMSPRLTPLLSSSASSPWFPTCSAPFPTRTIAAGVNLVTLTPPLACFQADSGEQGPYTIESDIMHQLFGIEIGIVSLPATYRSHPVIWSVLSHEVCGHDVVHADDGLLQEMTAAAQALLAPDFSPRKRLDTAALNALLRSYWMDEAAADVYGVLNMGPAFGLSLAAFVAAFRAHIKTDIKGEPRPAKPTVATEASPRDHEGGDTTLEDHRSTFSGSISCSGRSMQ